MISRPPSRTTRAFAVRSFGVLAIVNRRRHHGIIKYISERYLPVKQGFQVMANTREPILHPIPILSLRPTQMTVGMREVKEKRKRMREYWKEHKSKKKQGEFLGKHMIPVVLGPDKDHYV